jgi:hypothetical protein
MDKAAGYRKIVTTLLSAVLLLFIQLKPLHHLIVRHSVVENKDIYSIHKTKKHCVVCDYHFSCGIAAASPLVNFVLQRYVFLKAVALSYYIPAIIFDNYKRGPPAIQ